jgi:hypothetical protein
MATFCINGPAWTSKHIPKAWAVKDQETQTDNSYTRIYGKVSAQWWHLFNEKLSTDSMRRTTELP